MSPIALAFLVAVWLVVVAAQLSGASVFRSDGLYYTDMALRFSGQSSQQAAAQTLEWYARLGTNVPGSYLDPAVNRDWLLVQPRVVYPALSVPFVWAFGIPGMLAVPALSLLVTVLLVGVAGSRDAGPTPAFAAAVLLLVSTFVVGWSTNNVTDGVAMGEAAILVSIVLMVRPPLTVRALAAVGLVVSLLCFTRQTGPIAVGLVLAPYLWETRRVGMLRNDWLPAAAVTAVVAVACTLFAMWWAPFPLEDEMTRATGYASLTEALLNLPHTILRMGLADLSAVVARDHALLVLLAAALVAVVRCSRSIVVAMAIGASVGAIGVGAINGTLTTDFRYFMPAVPALALAAALGIRELTTCWGQAEALGPSPT